MKKRVISWLLCLALCLSMLPMAALAEDVVRGQACVDDCTVLMRRRMEAVLRALGKDE